MTSALVVTPWAGDGKSIQTAFRPALALTNPLARWSDATGQSSDRLPPVPNFVAIIATLDDANAASLFADPTWRPSILWMDYLLPPDEVPPDSEFSAMQAAFVAATGQPLALVQAATGAAVGGRTRSKIGDDAVKWLKSLG
jgi:hypothetical protein